MEILVGILAAAAVAVFVHRTVRDIRQFLALFRRPDPVQLRREQKTALVLITILVVLVTAALVGLAGAYEVGNGLSAGWVIGAGAVGLLAALWSPWVGLRVLASLSLVTVTVIGMIAALFIAAGGPDSRGENLPYAAVILLVAVLVSLLPFALLAHAEFFLWRGKRAAPEAASGRG
jgi:hypothetical protein